MLMANLLDNDATAAADVIIVIVIIVTVSAMYCSKSLRVLI